MRGKAGDSWLGCGESPGLKPLFWGCWDGGLKATSSTGLLRNFCGIWVALGGRAEIGGKAGWFDAGWGACSGGQGFLGLGWGKSRSVRGSVAVRAPGLKPFFWGGGTVA